MQKHDNSGGFVIQERPLKAFVTCKNGVVLTIYGVPLDFYWTYAGGSLVYIETFFRDLRYDNLKEINSMGAHNFFRNLREFASYKAFERGELTSNCGCKLDIDVTIFEGEKIVFDIVITERNKKPILEKYQVTLHPSSE
jgi:hypothetical protein